LLHTPLKRARLPITPPEQIVNGYLFSELSDSSTGADVFEFESAGAAVFEFESPLSTAVFESVEDEDSTGVSGLLLNTETFPVSAGIESIKAESMNTDAAVIVIFDRTVAVPRGAKAELEILLVNKAPASVLPGCSRTAATRTKQERKNNPYKK